MPFKIVQTIEAGNIVLTAVPSMWEENNILFWPNNRSKIRTLLQEEYSMPHKEKWDRISCILKRKDITTIELAEKEIDAMAVISDTEGENADNQIVGSNTRKKRILEATNIPDFNNQIPFKMRQYDKSARSSEHCFEYLPDDEELQQAISKPTVSVAGDNGISAPKIMVLEHLTLPAPQLHQIPMLAPSTDNNMVILSQDNLNDGIIWDGSETTTTNMLRAVLENQGKIIAQQAKLQTSLDTLATLMAGGNHDKTVTSGSDENNDGMVFNPIRSAEDINKLEESLSNISFFKKVVKCFSIICGTSGKSCGLDSCYKLIDHFFCRDFLAKCSWTGNTKNPDASKIALKFYKNVRKCFLSIILLADKGFDAVQCEIFFKRILKNSLARKSQHKYVSKHKIRPSNLHYKKKIEDEPGTSKGKIEDEPGTSKGKIEDEPGTSKGKNEDEPGTLKEKHNNGESLEKEKSLLGAEELPKQDNNDKKEEFCD